MTTKSHTAGLDLGDRHHAVCVLDEAGEIVSEQTLANTRKVLVEFSNRHAGAMIALETGTHSPWVSRLFESLGHRVHVANLRRIVFPVYRRRVQGHAHAGADGEMAFRIRSVFLHGSCRVLMVANGTVSSEKRCERLKREREQRKPGDGNPFCA